MAEIDRWVNAVVVLRLPLDVPVDGGGAAKSRAALDAVSALKIDGDWTGEIGWEVVVDGEPLERHRLPDRLETPSR